MRYFIILLLSIVITSCGSYRFQQRGPEITHVLALTSEGDTLKVPIQDLQRKLTPDYYDGYRFYWNNSWWLYSDWYWNYWYPNPRLYSPRYYIQRPKVVTPQPRTWRYRTNIEQRRNGVSPQPSRGRSNVQPWVKPQLPPRVQPRPTRPSTPSRNNNNQQPSRTRGGVIIKQ